MPKKGDLDLTGLTIAPEDYARDYQREIAEYLAPLNLIQYVLLGEHWRPNRAAAGNARSRSLVSYCLCDTNTVRDGEPHYTRHTGVTIMALEFTCLEFLHFRFSTTPAPRAPPLLIRGGVHLGTPLLIQEGWRRRRRGGYTRASALS